MDRFYYGHFIQQMTLSPSCNLPEETRCQQESQSCRECRKIQVGSKSNGLECRYSVSHRDQIGSLKHWFLILL